MEISKNISRQQRLMLHRATSGGSRRMVASFLKDLSQNEDILSGEEPIHPDWLAVYEEHKERLPSPIKRDIEEFFDKLKPYDEVLTRLDPSTVKISFLLGAGASKPEPSNIPTVKELLPQLLERARRLDREDVNKLADFCDRHRIVNIEDLLTAAELATFSSRNPTILRLLNYLLYRTDSEGPVSSSRVYQFFGETMEPVRARAENYVGDLASVAFLQDTLQVLFGLLSSTMLPAKPNAAHKAIALYAKERPSAYIITTNYDCCVDLALGDVSNDFIYRIDFSNVDDQRQFAAEDCTKLIKLHGSLNWFYCETCQEVQLIDIRRTVKSFQSDETVYPVIGICKDCGGQRRGLLVPPLAMKFDAAPPLTPLLREAKLAFDTADLIVVVGFSFAEADVYISRMLSKSMQASARQRLLIVDPDHEVCDRVRRKFTASIPSFDSGLFPSLCG